MKRRVVTVATVLFVGVLGIGGFFGVPYYDRTVLADRAFKQGNEAFQQKDWPAAEEHFTTAIRKRPEGGDSKSTHNLSVCYSRRAEVRDRLGRFDEALQDFAKAIELAPRVPILYLLRGAAFLRRDQFNSADSDLKECIALDAGITDAAYLLGISAEKQGKLDEAVTYYRKTIEMHGDEGGVAKEYFAKHHAALSRALGKAGDKSGSEASAARAKELHPSVSFEYTW